MALGALAHRLQRMQHLTARLIQNGRQGLERDYPFGRFDQLLLNKILLLDQIFFVSFLMGK